MPILKTYWREHKDLIVINLSIGLAVVISVGIALLMAQAPAR